MSQPPHRRSCLHSGTPPPPQSSEGQRSALLSWAPLQTRLALGQRVDEHGWINPIPGLSRLSGRMCVVISTLE